MNKTIHPNFRALETQITGCIAEFGSRGELLGEAVRNTIKIFDIGDLKVNIKSFKKPGAINSFIYRYIRKSKARRSYEYANMLLERGFGTPQPMAYFEDLSPLGLGESYYVSEQLAADLMFRELTTNQHYPDRENIIVQYTRFAYRLHEAGIEFIDNTSGNTLIKKNGPDYDFYLVDLNRMAFHASMPFEKRMENLAKLTTQPDIIRIMSREYARLGNIPEQTVHDSLSAMANLFLERFERRRRIKRRLKFWKK